MNIKKCTKCGIEGKLEENFYPTGKIGKNNKIYYQGQCKKCINEYKKTYWRKNKKYFIALQLKYQKTPMGKYCCSRVSAKRKKVPFTITSKQFIKTCMGTCFYCGETPAMGVDRRKPKWGYVFGNILPCCFKCNRGKFTDTIEDFINHCKKVTDFQNKGGIWNVKSN